MPVNTTAIWDLILQECGDVFGDPDYPLGIITPQIEVVWASYEDKARVPRLQELYAKLRCLELLWGYFKNQVGFEVPLELKWNANERVRSTERMMATVQAQVTALENKYAKVLSSYKSGPITKIEPRTPPPFQIPDPLGPFGEMDANSVRYTGDPYIETTRRIS